MEILKIKVIYSEGAFVATSDDITGLVCEAKDMAQLVQYAKELAPILIKENGVIVSLPCVLSFELNHAEILEAKGD